MPGNLLKEDGGVILKEDAGMLGLARKCDYKFGYIFNRGTTTDARIRYYEGEGTYTRIALLVNRLDTHQGSKTIEELRTYYNNELLSHGTPITEQT